MNETNSIPYLDQALKLNETLIGLPALPLVVLGALALGYFLKFIPPFPNAWIPFGVTVGAMAANVGIVMLEGSGDFIRAVILGMVAGVASIAIHRKWLKDLIDPKIFGMFLLVGLLSFGTSGCALFNGDKLEAGGAYAATETAPAQPELFALDASFDLAHSGLDTVFKFERDNRAMLWSISPDIKRRLDQLRLEARVVKRDYATARTAYLASPSPAGLDQLNHVIGKLHKANAAALAVLQTKGIQP